MIHDSITLCINESTLITSEFWHMNHIDEWWILCFLGPGIQIWKSPGHRITRTSKSGGCSFSFSERSPYISAIHSDHPSLLCTLLYSIYHVLYTRITFPTFRNASYVVFRRFSLSHFLYVLWCSVLCSWSVLGVFKVKKPIGNNSEVFWSSEMQFLYVLLLNCYIIMMINNETPQMKLRLVGGF